MLGERKKKRENQTITGYNPITISCNVPLQMKEDMTAHLERRRKASYIHRVASHALPKRCGRHPRAEHAPAALNFKNFERNVKTPKYPS
jgi:hypothetical protein